MFEETLCIVNLFELKTQINGRKRIQKVFYLLKHLGYDVPFRYSYNFYGHYSEDLQMELTTKLCLGLWEENYKGNECIYTAKPEKMLNFKEEISKIAGNVTHVQPYPPSLVDRLVATNVDVLELTSTLAYFIDQSKGGGAGDVKAQAKEETLKLKPHLKEKILQAEELYESLQQERKL